MREPAQLVIGTSTVSLSSESVEDTGHTIFHVAASVMSPIACASCHPEGGDDGRTWVFKGLGRRRTQTLRGGITQTAPFHWSGDEKDLGALMNDVFAKRMQGGMLSAPHVAALAGWLDTVPALPKIAPRDAAAAARGKVLYDGEAECASCHVGHLLTNRQTVDVGTGAPFQVPVLAGIRFRAPYMHDGCAKTLLDRFGACGGGDAHGKTSQLSKAQVADLVAYLETL
jgi:mono/diheme cytochrome c family protein